MCGAQCSFFSWRFDDGAGDCRIVLLSCSEIINQLKLEQFSFPFLPPGLLAPLKCKHLLEGFSRVRRMRAIIKLIPLRFGNPLYRIALVEMEQSMVPSCSSTIRAEQQGLRTKVQCLRHLTSLEFFPCQEQERRGVCQQNILLQDSPLIHHPTLTKDRHRSSWQTTNAGPSFFAAKSEILEIYSHVDFYVVCPLVRDFMMCPPNSKLGLHVLTFFILEKYPNPGLINRFSPSRVSYYERRRRRSIQQVRLYIWLLFGVDGVLIGAGAADWACVRIFFGLRIL